MLDLGLAEAVMLGVPGQLLEFSDAVGDGPSACLEVAQRDRPGLVGVDEAGLLGAQVGELARRVGSERLAGGDGAGAQDQVGVVEVADDLVPDELVELVGACGGL